MTDGLKQSADIVTRFTSVTSATASAVLSRIGVRDAFMVGPVARVPGARVVGPAVTLQFMPKREDLIRGQGEEHTEKRTALWEVLKVSGAGDVIVTDARGDMRTGCFGEMLLTYFKVKGGAGVIVDGCIRDFPEVKDLGLPVWTRGFTPNYASQTGLFPWAFNVPVACGGVLVMPGDIVIADDDGATVVPIGLAEQVLQQTLEHQDWEAFSRKRLREGGDISKYYPLSDEGRQEFEVWRASQKKA